MRDTMDASRNQCSLLIAPLGFCSLIWLILNSLVLFLHVTYGADLYLLLFQCIYPYEKIIDWVEAVDWVCLASSKGNKGGWTDDSVIDSIGWLPQDPGLILHTQMAVHNWGNSSARGCDSFFCPLRTPGTHILQSMHADKTPHPHI